MANYSMIVRMGEASIRNHGHGLIKASIANCAARFDLLRAFTARYERIIFRFARANSFLSPVKRAIAPLHALQIEAQFQKRTCKQVKFNI